MKITYITKDLIDSDFISDSDVESVFFCPRVL